MVAKEAADDGRKALVAANRAWLGVVNASLSKAPQTAGEQLRVTILFANSGKEPSVDADSINMFDTIAAENNGGNFKKIEHGYVDQCFKTGLTGASHVFFSQPSSVTPYRDTLDLDTRKIDWDVVYGLKIMLLHGCFIYRSFDSVRHTSYCYYFRTGNKPDGFDNFLTSLPLCDEGNDAN